MTEWLLLIVLVPAVVVPVVLLFGFAGCSKVFGIHDVPDPPVHPAPMIQSASGTSIHEITLAWLVDPSATGISFERQKLTTSGPVDPAVTFTPPPSPFVDGGLDPATTYQYVAFAIFADGDKSAPSAAVTGATLGPPSFDAVGTGGSGTGVETATATWSHTPAGLADIVIVGVRWSHSRGFLPQTDLEPTRTVTYGGTAMQSLGAIGQNNASLVKIENHAVVFQELFGLLHPPPGTQSVSLTVARKGANALSVSGCSVSYLSVSAFDTLPSVYGIDNQGGTSMEQDAASAQDELVVQMFTTASGDITEYSQTPRYESAPNGIDMVIGDGPGATTVVFSATRSDDVAFAGTAVRLLPIS